MKIRAFSLFLSPLKTENEMEILITNDDGYRAKGIKVLAEMMKQFGNITVIAPKHHQSGMSTPASTTGPTRLPHPAIQALSEQLQRPP